MKRIIQFACVAAATALVGCAVHDGHEEEPAPIWWPNFVYRPSTHPTTEEYDMTRGGSLPGDATPVVATAQPRDVRSEWNPIYAEHPVSIVTPGTVDSGIATSIHPVDPASPASATLYPNRGQAALAAQSATLYPPTNEFNGGPARTVSVFPRGPLAPTGYLGR